MTALTTFFVLYSIKQGQKKQRHSIFFLFFCGYFLVSALSCVTILLYLEGIMNKSVKRTKTAYSVKIVFTCRILINLKPARVLNLFVGTGGRVYARSLRILRSFPFGEK